MKRFFLLSLLLVTTSFGMDIAAVSTAAQRDYLTGNLADAKIKFAQILKADPNNVAAKGYLRMIAAAEAKEGGPTIKDSLQKVMLAKVTFKDATIGSALDYLKQQASKQNAPVSFVYQVPRDTLDTAKVSLDLTNVPFLSALSYACQLARLEYVIQQYAILIRPMGAPEASPTPAPQ